MVRRRGNAALFSFVAGLTGHSFVLVVTVTVTSGGLLDTLWALEFPQLPGCRLHDGHGVWRGD